MRSQKKRKTKQRCVSCEKRNEKEMGLCTHCMLCAEVKVAHATKEGGIYCFCRICGEYVFLITDKMIRFDIGRLEVKEPYDVLVSDVESGESMQRLKRAIMAHKRKGTHTSAQNAVWRVKMHMQMQEEETREEWTRNVGDEIKGYMRRLLPKKRTHPTWKNGVIILGENLQLKLQGMWSRGK